MGDQFVALDGGVVMDGPAILTEGFGGVVDTKRTDANCSPGAAELGAA